MDAYMIDKSPREVVAINDAVAPYGVRFEKLPIRMTKISDAVAAARSGKA